MSETLVLDSFLGIDASKSEYEIHKSRATDMINLISEAGVNHKRKGFHERAQFEPTEIKENENTILINNKINGIYQLGNSDELIVHAGSDLWRVKINNSKPFDPEKTKLTIPTGVVILDAPSWGVYTKNTLYLFVGAYLYYYDNELHQSVNNYEYTYIPTTTSSIDAEGVADDERRRIDFEDFNILTKWRINSLQGKAKTSSGTELDRTYYLDDSIDQSEIVTVSYTDLSGTSVEYKTRQEDSGKSEKELFKNSTKVGKVYCLEGKIVFDHEQETYRGEDGIKVLFAIELSSEYKRVTNCKFGMLFGLRGNNDRLFISGNSNYPNMDFYSESNDYTYFPSPNYTELGSSSSSITGYSRINDGSLAIHKSVGDSSGIYYRTSTVETKKDTATGSSITRTIFPITAGAVGEFCESNRTCHRLGDDPLFLSNNGVCSIALGSNATTNERYAKERSENIRNLLPYEKYKAVAEVMDGRYYLFVNDKCYIADSRYKYSDKHLADDTFNYEWWVWQMPAVVTSVCNKHNFMYIGTVDGRIWSQDLNYVDKSYEILVQASTTASVEENKMTISDTTLVRWNEYEKVLCSDDIQYISRKIRAKDYTDMKPVYEKGSVILYTADVSVPIQAGVIQIKPTTGLTIKARIIEDVVTAKYSSGAISFGTNSSYKKITKIALTTDAESMSKFSLRLEGFSSKVDIEVEQLGVFDFNKIDFGHFNFGDKTFSNSIIKRVRMRNINYLQISLLSDSNRDCVLNNVTIEYDMTGKITGGIR